MKNSRWPGQSPGVAARSPKNCTCMWNATSSSGDMLGYAGCEIVSTNLSLTDSDWLKWYSQFGRQDFFVYRLRSAAWNAISSKRQKLTHGDFLTFRTSLQKRSQRCPRSHIYSKSAPLARRRGKVNAPPPPGDPGEIVIFDAGPRRNFFSPTSFSETASVEDFFNWLRNRI